MIIRVIAHISSIRICLCLALALFSAGRAWGAGHTIRNGGGDEELAFVETWASADRKLAACLHPRGPCELTASERRILSSLLELKKNCFQNVRVKATASTALSAGGCGDVLQVNSRSLYEEGRAKNATAMLALTLEILRERSCDSRLIAADFDADKIARSAAQVDDFATLKSPDGGEYILQSLARGGSSSLTIAKDARVLDLVAVLRSQSLRLGGPLKLEVASRALVEGKIEISGEVRPQGGSAQSFFLSIPLDLDPAKTFVYLE